MAINSASDTCELHFMVRVQKQIVPYSSLSFPQAEPARRANFRRYEKLGIGGITPRQNLSIMAYTLLLTTVKNRECGSDAVDEMLKTRQINLRATPLFSDCRDNKG